MPEAITDNLDLWTSALLTKSTAGRGSNGKLEAYGIKKLRELILELAVRGKLVPQDPNDEPASGLLKTIAAEKTRLVKQGVIRKEDFLPAIADEEKLYQIPKSWEWVRLTDVYYSISPSGKKLKTSEIVGEGKHPVVDQGQSYIAGYTNDSELLIVIPGPVVIFGDHTTEIKYIDFDFVAGADGTKILRPYLMDERFFYTYLKSYKLENRGYARHFKVLNDNLYALPPIAEQHRIVAKVDELMAMCDELEQQQTHSIEAHQTLVEILLGTLTRVETQQEFSAALARIASYFDILFTTEASIDQLKLTILQLAVMGKLVSQDPNDEPASMLLEEIATEKARLVEEGKIKKEKQPTDITTAVEPFDIPERWAWTDLSQLLALVTDGDHQAPPQSQEGVPFLVIGNLNTGKINFDGCKYVPIDYYEKLDWVRKPVAGDLLYTVTGSFGIPVPVETREQFCVQRHVAILKATDSTPRRYLELVLGSKFAIEYATTIATGIAQKTVPLTGLRRMPIPVAPKNEQHRIVAKVDELMALCDSLKARLADAQAIQLHLADAIVEQATLD